MFHNVYRRKRFRRHGKVNLNSTDGNAIRRKVLHTIMVI